MSQGTTPMSDNEPFVPPREPVPPTPKIDSEALNDDELIGASISGCSEVALKAGRAIPLTTEVHIASIDNYLIYSSSKITALKGVVPHFLLVALVTASVLLLRLDSSAFDNSQSLTLDFVDSSATETVTTVPDAFAFAETVLDSFFTPESTVANHILERFDTLQGTTSLARKHNDATLVGLLSIRFLFTQKEFAGDASAYCGEAAQGFLPMEEFSSALMSGQSCVSDLIDYESVPVNYFSSDPTLAGNNSFNYSGSTTTSAQGGALYKGHDVLGKLRASYSPLSHAVAGYNIVQLDLPVAYNDSVVQAAVKAQFASATTTTATGDIGAVVIEALLFDASTNGLTSVMFLFESVRKGSGTRILTYPFRVQAMDWTDAGIVITFVVDCLLLCYWIYWVVELMQTLKLSYSLQRHAGRFAWFDFWDVFNVFAFLMTAVYMVLKATHWYDGTQLIADVSTDDGTVLFGRLMEYRDMADWLIGGAGWLIMLVYLRSFFFLRFSFRLSTVSETIGSSRHEMVGVLLIFVMVFVCYGYGGVLIWGSLRNPEFGRFTWGINFLLLFLWNGEANNYEVFEDADTASSKIFFSTFFILSWIVLLNVVVGVLALSFASVTETLMMMRRPSWSPGSLFRDGLTVAKRLNPMGGSGRAQWSLYVDDRRQLHSALVDLQAQGIENFQSGPEYISLGYLLRRTKSRFKEEYVRVIFHKATQQIGTDNARLRQLRLAHRAINNGTGITQRLKNQATLVDDLHRTCCIQKSLEVTTMHQVTATNPEFRALVGDVTALQRILDVQLLQMEAASSILGEIMEDMDVLERQKKQHSQGNRDVSPGRREGTSPDKEPEGPGSLLSSLIKKDTVRLQNVVEPKQRRLIETFASNHTAIFWKYAKRHCETRQQEQQGIVLFGFSWERSEVSLRSRGLWPTTVRGLKGGTISSAEEKERFLEDVRSRSREKPRYGSVQPRSMESPSKGSGNTGLSQPPPRVAVVEEAQVQEEQGAGGAAKKKPPPPPPTNGQDNTNAVSTAPPKAPSKKGPARPPAAAKDEEVADASSDRSAAAPPPKPAPKAPSKKSSEQEEKGDRESSKPIPKAPAKKTSEPVEQKDAEGAATPPRSPPPKAPAKKSSSAPTEEPVTPPAPHSSPKKAPAGPPPSQGRDAAASDSDDDAPLQSSVSSPDFTKMRGDDEAAAVNLLERKEKRKLAAANRQTATNEEVGPDVTEDPQDSADRDAESSPTGEAIDQPIEESSETKAPPPKPAPKKKPSKSGARQRGGGGTEETEAVTHEKTEEDSAPPPTPPTAGPAPSPKPTPKAPSKKSSAAVAEEETESEDKAAPAPSPKPTPKAPSKKSSAAVAEEETESDDKAAPAPSPKPTPKAPSKKSSASGAEEETESEDKAAPAPSPKPTPKAPSKKSAAKPEEGGPTNSKDSPVKDEAKEKEPAAEVSTERPAPKPKPKKPTPTEVKDEDANQVEESPGTKEAADEESDTNSPTKAPTAPPPQEEEVDDLKPKPNTAPKKLASESGDTPASEKSPKASPKEEKAEDPHSSESTPPTSPAKAPAKKAVRRAGSPKPAPKPQPKKPSKKEDEAAKKKQAEEEAAERRKAAAERKQQQEIEAEEDRKRQEAEWRNSEAAKIERRLSDDEEEKGRRAVAKHEDECRQTIDFEARTDKENQQASERYRLRQEKVQQQEREDEEMRRRRAEEDRLEEERKVKEMQRQKRLDEEEAAEDRRAEAARQVVERRREEERKRVAAQKIEEARKKQAEEDRRRDKAAAAKRKNDQQSFELQREESLVQIRDERRKKQEEEESKRRDAALEKKEEGRQRREEEQGGLSPLRRQNSISSSRYRTGSPGPASSPSGPPPPIELVSIQKQPTLTLEQLQTLPEEEQEEVIQEEEDRNQLDRALTRNPIHRDSQGRFSLSFGFAKAGFGMQPTTPHQVVNPLDALSPRSPGGRGGAEYQSPSPRRGSNTAGGAPVASPVASSKRKPPTHRF